MAAWDTALSYSKWVISASLLLYVCAMLLERALMKGSREEPPMVYPYIPLFGHIVGMWNSGSQQYFKKLSEGQSSPICSASIFGSKMYFIKTPSLVSQMQRSSRTLEFSPINQMLTIKMNGFSDAAHKLMSARKPTTCDDSLWTSESISKRSGSEKLLSLEQKVHDMQISVLGPGMLLDGLSQVQLQKVAEVTNEILTDSDSMDTDFFIWTRNLMTISNMHAVYGPRNIIAQDATLEKDFWTYSDTMPLICAGPAARFLNPKAWAALLKLKAALQKWAADGGPEQASSWVRATQRLYVDHGFSQADAATFEMSHMFGVLANASPTSFWVLSYVFADEELLERLRLELQSPAILRTEVDIGDGKQRCTISIPALKTDAPLLNSVFRETLRIVNPSVSARVVSADTYITDTDGRRYLLKKGAVCQALGSVIHDDETVWGHDATVFNPDRFVLHQNGTKTRASTAPRPESDALGERPLRNEMVHPAAYRAFGGGVSLCPGRHFAANEINGLVALFVLGFDLEKPDGSRFEIPERKMDYFLPLSVGSPVNNVPARIRRRKGYGRSRWGFVNESFR